MIATLPLNNVSSLVLYDIAGEDALIGLNDDKPDWYGVCTDEDGVSYIDTPYGTYYVDEFITTFSN